MLGGISRQKTTQRMNQRGARLHTYGAIGCQHHDLHFNYLMCEFSIPRITSIKSHKYHVPQVARNPYILKGESGKTVADTKC